MRKVSLVEDEALVCRMAKPIGMHDMEQALAEAMSETKSERTDLSAVLEP